ncbi:MAG: hypothetical protein KGJ41_06085 [Rhodospirillales bacterium]|nr:hypothetical protein [Rhodospirillales bacterium]MDE2575478.1 hypothetical protein [Rhodospirillales bacterium]
MEAAFPLTAPGCLIFAEEFDISASAPKLGAPASAAPAADPAEALRECEAAAFLRGLREGEALREAETVRLIEAGLHHVAAALAEAREESLAMHEEWRLETARLVMQSLMVVLPDAMARLGDGEAARFAEQLLPRLDDARAIILHTPPVSAATMASLLARQPPHIRAAVTIAPQDHLGPGDIELHWRGGRARRDARQAMQRLRDTLRQFGLLDDQSVPAAQTRAATTESGSS